MSETLSAEERGRLGAAKRWGTKEVKESKSDRPKYRITEVCHHNDRIYDPAMQPKDEDGEPKPLYMEFDGPPSYYMEPANEAAQAMYEKYPPTPWIDPINAMTRLPTDKVAA